MFHEGIIVVHVCHLLQTFAGASRQTAGVTVFNVRCGPTYLDLISDSSPEIWKYSIRQLHDLPGYSTF